MQKAGCGGDGVSLGKLEPGRCVRSDAATEDEAEFSKII